jgi:hypothetical protein
MKSKQPSSPGNASVFYLACGFVAGAIVVGSSWLTTRKSTPSPDAVHDVTVTYMYETDPGSASGSNDQFVKSIKFHPSYVVMTGASGDSTLFAVDRLREFHYKPAVVQGQ